MLPILTLAQAATELYKIFDDKNAEMYFIVTKEMAVFFTSMFGETLKSQVLKGEITIIDVKCMKYMNHQAEWVDVSEWEHPFNDDEQEDFGDVVLDGLKSFFK